MMKDVECPYCGAWQDINHDDGYGFDEDLTHQQECIECEKTFVYTTAINYYHTVSKADCLNGAEHKYKAMPTYPIEFTRMECQDCGDRREPTEGELKDILREAKS